MGDLPPLNWAIDRQKSGREKRPAVEQIIRILRETNDGVWNGDVDKLPYHIH